MNEIAPRMYRAGRQLRAERAPVSMPASIVTLSAYQYPELADISRSGAKLKGTDLPPKGSTALLRAGPLEILCRVMWVKDQQCGIRFEEPVPLEALKQIQMDGEVSLAAVEASARFSEGGD